MNVVHVTCQMFQAATIGIFLTLNTISPIKSSKFNNDYNPEDTFKTIQTSIDSKIAENGYFGSYIHPNQPTAEFSQLQGNIDEEISGLNFNFDQADNDKFNLPQKQSVQPTFLLNYEPLRPSNFISPQPSHYANYPFDFPEHQDDGSDGGDGDDGGDDGGDGGGGGGGGVVVMEEVVVEMAVVEL
ncbi:uncharacterized protein LOC112684917 [Sipha flava]|uniref:Uncharacterized protein LOC112684917 n=1 Tax=Sipha flava TaxID=143950 RepID=A0A8B8FPZ7_9HEMI|nr:uncharacterized protein LOC112684917 [Sipha flava]